VLAVCAAIWFIPPPSGITPKSWHLLAIFVATITGSIVRPVPGGAMVLIGVAALALTGTLTTEEALAGYADPIVWLVLAAFFMSRGMIKTGLGRRIAFTFIRAIGRHSLASFAQSAAIRWAWATRWFPPTCCWGCSSHQMAPGPVALSFQ